MAVVSNIVRSNETPANNAAHRALLYSRGGHLRELKQMEEALDAKRAEVAELLNSVDAKRQMIREIEAVIVEQSFTPADGFDLWGERLPDGEAVAAATPVADEGKWSE